ncbi:MAG: methyltransferase domain-containing protein [Pseudomonadota bacterium]|nr:methyltransferase domain-containing protein [Pseudomonadota bacterium]MDO7711912.1 methyltransferase domain-containing protein [Pseudomonadota bacterium]
MSRKEHWEKIYKEKSPLDVSWYQNKPLISLSLIYDLAMGKDENIIDVGGGPSTLVDCLIEEGFKNISVLDLSSNALMLAKSRLGKKSKLVTWQINDVTQFTPEKAYSLWHDRAVFHFLTEKRDREKYKEVLASALKVGGYVIIAAFSIGGPTKCSGLDIVQYDAEKINQEFESHFKLINVKSETHITPAGKEQLFGYYVLTKNG